MAQAAAATYPIMDESGKVREWIDAGRGVRVWESHDIGAGRPDMMTPGDVTMPPHWAYPIEGSRVLQTAEVTFYRRSYVVEMWSDTPAGWKAAERMLPKLERERTAPIGKVLTSYTFERLSLETTERVKVSDDYSRPLHTISRVAIVAWTAIVRESDESEA
jgi:hypothetical protein